MFDISAVRTLCGTDAELVTKHCQIRMEKRGISIADAEYAVMNGEIIEEYPDDYPFPSCLIFGTTDKEERIHLVCSLGDHHLYFITAYKPDLLNFEEDYKTRRKDGSE